MLRTEQADGLTRSGQTLKTLFEAFGPAALPKLHDSPLDRKQADQRRDRSGESAGAAARRTTAGGMTNAVPRSKRRIPLADFQPEARQAR